MVKLKARPLNLSVKKLNELKNEGFVALTFVGENLQPFYCFAKEDELSVACSEEVNFNWGGEFISAKFLKHIGEGWSTVKDIMLFEFESEIYNTQLCA